MPASLRCSDRGALLLRTAVLFAGLGVLAPGCGNPPKEGTPASKPPSEATQEETTPSAPQAPAGADAGSATAAEAEAGSAAPSEPAVAADPAPQPDPAPQNGLATLTDEQRATLISGAQDAPFAVDTHYIQSNETRHDLYFPYVDGIGGAFIGVGSDQSFTIAAAAHSELMFMMDIDARVVELQKMYAVLVPAAESAQALVEAFHEKNKEATKATLTEAFSDMGPRELTKLLRGFRVGRETVYRHLMRVVSRTADGKPVTWLSDPEMFAHIQDLYRKGRVRVMVGNLAGTNSMRTVGQVCKDLGVPVRVLYMSNAEEYFKYTDDFRANIESLPLDDARSVVLRTIYSKRWVHADLWAYQVQPILDFRGRLADRKNRSRNPMLRLAENAKELTRKAGPRGLSLVALELRS
ncbi:MAG: hypothetical protein JKY37_14420 [Nannocystaceae bacterium]|nr:hypothetical protein [Nannocystaceae bacterium]